MELIYYPSNLGQIAATSKTEFFSILNRFFLVFPLFMRFPALLFNSGRQLIYDTFLSGIF